MSNKGSSWIHTTVGSDQECQVLEWRCDMFYVSWLMFDLSTGIFAMLRSRRHTLLVVYQRCIVYFSLSGRQQWWLWLLLLSPEMLLMSVRMWNTADESRINLMSDLKDQMIGLSGQRFMVSMCLKQGQLNIKINFLLFSWKLFSARKNFLCF